MNMISTSIARTELPRLINTLHRNNDAFVIGRHKVPEAILIKFPSEYRKNVSDSTLINANGGTFDFLNDEPDIYSLADIKK